MTDYLDEYGDELESIQHRLEHALECVAQAKDYLRRGLALKASYEVFEAGTNARSTEAYIRGLYQALDREAKQ